MKASIKFGLIWIGVILLLIVIIDASSKKPVIWERTFAIKDKNPFGSYVLHRELPYMLPKVGKDIDRPLYEYLQTPVSRKANIFFINNTFGLGEAAEKKLLDYVKAGGKAMIVSERFETGLLDSLGIKLHYFYGYKNGVDVNRALREVLTNDTARIAYPKTHFDVAFLNLPRTATILGGIVYRRQFVPNFVQIPVGKGQLLIHLAPDLFGNYYLLHTEQHYAYVAKALSYLGDKPVVWYDFQAQLQQYDTPLRVVLSSEGLRQGWYILLSALLLLLIFKSKREQRAVAVVKPEPNLSKDFCATIASLYYENGTPGNMVGKKIDFFLHDLRTRFHVDTLRLADDEFARHLSERTGVDNDTTSTLVRMMLQMQRSRNLTVKELKAINEKIEDFKQKAKMI